MKRRQQLALELYAPALRRVPCAVAEVSAPVDGALAGEVMSPAEMAANTLARGTVAGFCKPARHFIERQQLGTQAAYRHALDVCATILSSGAADRDTLPWQLVDYPNAQRLVGELARRYRPATANKILAAFRGLLDDVWQLARAANLQVDYVALEQARKVKNVPGRSEVPRGQPLSTAEMAALFATCAADATARGRRDAALFALLRQTGGRRFEVAALDVGDYDAASARLRFRTGKRGRERVCVLVDEAKRLVDVWLEVRSESSGPLLCPVGRGGRVRVARITGGGILKIMTKRCDEAGMRHHSPHDWRHTLATELHAAGVPLREIQEHLGHA